MNYHSTHHLGNSLACFESLLKHAFTSQEWVSGEHDVIVLDQVVNVETGEKYEAIDIPAGLDFDGLTCHIHDTAAGDGIIVVQDKTRVAVIRPPFSQQRIYVTKIGGRARFMRNLADFPDLPRTDINWGGLFRSLANFTYFSTETGLTGVNEILSGTICSVDEGRIRLDERILKIACTLTTIDDDFEKAAATIRRFVADAIAHKTGDEARGVGLAISGGLDSAVLAGFSRERFPDLRLHLLNLYSPSSQITDERAKALAVAERLKLPIEFLDIDPFTYTNDLGSRFEQISFRPTKSFLTLGLTHAMRQRVSAAKVTTLLSGDGGDQLFLRFRTPSLIKELVEEDKGDIGQIRRLIDYAALNCESFWDISWDYLSGQTASRIKNLFVAQAPKVRFINQAFSNIEGEAVVSGSADRWQSESRKFQFFGMRDSEVNHCDIANVPVQERKPFLYWPLIRYCMRLKRSVHTHDGRDRALERAAFKDCLPEAIYASEAKGGADDPKNRFDHVALATSLLGGELVRRSLLDKDQLCRIEGNTVRTDEACVLARARTIEDWLASIRRMQQ